MNRTSPSEVKAWCIGRGFHPNKTLGQNFLIDRNILEGIVDAAGVDGQSRVLEVGPGLGVVTEELLRRGARVTAVEKDGRLAAELAVGLGAEYPEQLTLVAGDMLDQDLDVLLAPCFDAFVSNLPYSVGTRILIDVALHRLAPPVLTVMVQTEVAERMAAAEGDEARGQGSVWMQLLYDARIVRKVKPSCFWPRPEVDSTIIRFTRHDRCTLTGPERACFFDLTKYAFMHRRKQLGALLRKAAPPLGRPDDLLAAAFALAQIDPALRPEAVSVAAWERLARALAGAC